ncbi:MAG: MarR family winged helix-turn-helix transcriptional regulator [Flavobacteriales bacterium]|jgi:DNA-binding MarR family transcriptional regulator
MASIQDDLRRCLYFSASAMARVLDRSAREQFGRFELSPTQGFILITVKQAPGISVGDLAVLLVLDQSTVTKTLEKMQLKGLVQRETFGRSVRVFLTTLGERKEADASAAWKKVRSAYQQLVGEGEVRALCTGLHKAEGQFVEG